MGAMVAALFLESGAGLGTFNSLGCGDDNSMDVAARAERILNSFYNDQQKRHARERELLESKGCDAVGSRKWNQQEVYLDLEKRTCARAASRQYLERHRDWLSGPRKVGDVALQDLVAVQHYVDLDVEDLSLPEAERRNGDVFLGPDGNICEPFLQDATRCSITVDGRKFSFQSRCERRGAAIAEDPAEVQRLREAFIDDLVAAVLRSLGPREKAPTRLVRAVTSAMSQSGLASVERACYSSQVVVSGGDQTVRYKLQSREDDSWDVMLSVQKVRFEECIICSQFFEDPVIVACSPKSFVSKACTIRFYAPRGSSDVRADVIKLRKEMCLVNLYGSLVTGHALDGRPHPWENWRPPRGEQAPFGIFAGNDDSTEAGDDEDDDLPEEAQDHQAETGCTLDKQASKTVLSVEDE
mmetsp:Transcript_93189/g.259581  ORF Transcript_93189/g.259581 Transcript_93189/m.259581 type:complete len:412 (+) Transcript_93189:59-1294(+)|eukprot:CAMPEP_0179147570 /NCGR_PEP_ID=MMETSP0796-20121207/71347_1 /TAXON_ID=73915 /ORGANISM="Pyrodinium bahamense, Strain pbaha01" /LENGTH=411 /DNA_ID=CAMNT_0020848183 /DNA_START=37 /DNA_END=1272 /DNA_ORIENTATION=+